MEKKNRGKIQKKAGSPTGSWNIFLVKQKLVKLRTLKSSKEVWILLFNWEGGKEKKDMETGNLHPLGHTTISTDVSSRLLCPNDKFIHKNGRNLNHSFEMGRKGKRYKCFCKMSNLKEWTGERTAVAWYAKGEGRER